MHPARFSHEKGGNLLTEALQSYRVATMPFKIRAVAFIVLLMSKSGIRLVYDCTIQQYPQKEIKNQMITAERRKF